jgi:tyrosyl-tRNA synthetase
LDSKRTSPYRFYQFFVQSDDRDVIKLLKVLTFLPADQIAALEQDLVASPGARAPHKALAREVTTLVHGEAAAQEAVRASEILFGGDLAGVGESTFNELLGEVPTKTLEASRLSGTGMLVTELLVHAALSGSKGQARTDIQGGGASLNNVRVGEVQRAVTTADLLFGKHLLLRKGRRNYAVVTVQG